ncbi:MAG: hypothetical protein ABWW66_02390 [Archaeoglobaceae archaeon]
MCHEKEFEEYQNRELTTSIRYVRVFGLYGHPQPKDGATWKIKNADGLSLPTTLAGEPAREYLISEEFLKICNQCHSRGFAEGHFEKFEKTVNAWEKGIADTIIFDEFIEKTLDRELALLCNYLSDTARRWVDPIIQLSSSGGISSLGIYRK